MKTGFLLLSTVFALNVSAQNIKLKTGQKIKNATTFSMDMDMGMGGQMTMSTETVSNLDITGTDAAGYTATSTVTKMKMSQDGGGQSSTFDSDKKEDADSEMGKALSKTVGKTTKVTISSETGKAALLEKPVTSEDADDPMAMFSGMGDQGAESSAAAAFYVIPAGKKVGDKWSETSEVNGMKSTNDFELVSLSGNSAVINVKTKTAGTVTKEANGMTIDVAMNTTQTGTLELDPTNSLVKKRTMTGDMTGTLEVMGQSMPITGKLSTTSTFE